MLGESWGGGSEHGTGNGVSIALHAVALAGALLIRSHVPDGPTHGTVINASSSSMRVSSRQPRACRRRPTTPAPPRRRFRVTTRHRRAASLRRTPRWQRSRRPR